MLPPKCNDTPRRSNYSRIARATFVFHVSFRSYLEALNQSGLIVSARILDKRGEELKQILSVVKHLSFYLNDWLAPVLVKLRTPKNVMSSKNQILSLINYMKPNVSSVPLQRFGPKGDGGYLVPDDFDGIVACFSPGVSDVAGFELELAERGIPCYLIDASVKDTPEKHENIFFERLFLGPKSDGKRFISLPDWVQEKAPGKGDLLLQIDIEGAEYEALLATPADMLKRFRLIVLELHDLDFIMTNKYSAVGFEAFLKHMTSEFYVVHIHPNNNRRPVMHEGVEIPPVIEMTLVRRDRSRKGSSETTSMLPHELDSDNSPRRKHLFFSKDWVN
jgi:hypothetical protein